MTKQFKIWLSTRGKADGTVASYSNAIQQLSVHYSEQTGTQTDIYQINDQNLMNTITREYGRNGQFYEFGNQQNGRFRAAIRQYAEFLVNNPNDNILNDNETNPEEEVSQNGSRPFTYEKDLQTSLCTQIPELFPDYRIFGTNSEGIEYSVGQRRVDVLLEHTVNNNLLAVELKSGEATFQVFGQICMYLGLLQEHFPDRKITGMIIAGAIQEGLKQACSITDKVSLKIYHMHIELEDIQ